MRRIRRRRGRYRGMMSPLWVALTLVVVVIATEKPTAHLTILPRGGGGTRVAATAGYRQGQGGARIESWLRGSSTGRADRGDPQGGTDRWPVGQRGGGRGEGNGAPGHRGPGDHGIGNRAPGRSGPGDRGIGNQPPGHWRPGNGGFGNATPGNGHGRGGVGPGGGRRHRGIGSGPGTARPPSNTPAPPPMAPAPRPMAPAPPPTAPAPPPTAPPARATTRVAGRRHPPTLRRVTSSPAPRATLTIKLGGSHSSVAAASAPPAARAHHAPIPPAPTASRQTSSRVTRPPTASAARPALLNVAAKHAMPRPRATQTHASGPSPSTTAAHGSGSAAVPPRSQRAVPKAWVSPAAAVGDRPLTPLLTLPTVVLLLPVLGLCVMGRRR
jgi:hypothetical protein